MTKWSVLYLSYGTEISENINCKTPNVFHQVEIFEEMTQQIYVMLHIVWPEVETVKSFLGTVQTC